MPCFKEATGVRLPTPAHRSLRCLLIGSWELLSELNHPYRHTLSLSLSVLTPPHSCTMASSFFTNSYQISRDWVNANPCIDVTKDFSNNRFATHNAMRKRINQGYFERVVYVVVFSWEYNVEFYVTPPPNCFPSTRLISALHKIPCPFLHS